MTELKPVELTAVKELTAEQIEEKRKGAEQLVKLTAKTKEVEAILNGLKLNELNFVISKIMEDAKLSVINFE